MQLRPIISSLSRLNTYRLAVATVTGLSRRLRRQINDVQGLVVAVLALARGSIS
jgi:hypothetical protein